MKNFVKWFGITAIVTLIGFSMIACQNPVYEEDGKTSNGAIPLLEDEYLEGAITSSDKEQWYKFTATASTHYIHVSHGTLSDFSIQMYDSDKNTVGNRKDYHQSQLNGYGGWYSEITVTRGKVRLS